MRNGFGVLAALDTRLLRLLRTRGHSPRFERAVILYARAGENGLLWHSIAAAGALVDPRGARAYRRATAAVLLTMTVNTGIKALIRRARPALEELPALTPVISGRSYPSAHASTSFAAAQALSQVLPAPPLFAAAGAMALSRPYLGVHYPTDILAGAVLGNALGKLAS
ncbi:MAG TPA: phosphatase PAP2 family protein [Thermoleophilaceae bacterium]|nr:phosphatase PAP2 family protein [Thermoleophilaceae bacterium]